MPGTIEVPKSEQAQNYAALLTDLNNAVARFGELTPKMEAQFKAHAEDIAKLRDTVSAMERTSEQRFAAVLQRHQAGGEYSGHYASPEQARAVGNVLLAVAGRTRFAEADLRAAGVPLEAAAVAPSPDASGGYLVGDTLMREIVRNVAEAGVFEANCPAMDTTELKGGFPRRTGGLTVHYPEFGAAATASTPAFGRANFSLVRHAVLSVVDKWMLRANLAIPLAEFVAQELGDALALAEDTNWFIGTGTSSYGGYTGVFKDTGTLSEGGDSGDDTFVEMIGESSDYLARCIGTLPAQFHAGAKWYMHHKIFWSYMGIKDSAGAPVLAGVYASAGQPTLGLMGFPVALTAVAPSTTAVSTTMAILANLRKACKVLRFNGGGTIQFSEHHKFAEGQMAYLLDLPQDRVIVDPNGIVRLVTAAS